MARIARLLLLCSLAACGSVAAPAADAPPPTPDASTVDAPPAKFSLTVTRSGVGTGTVSSAPAGIDCGTSCTLQVTAGTQVTLTATPDANQDFTGWTGGGCSGTGTCVVTVNADTSIDAAFAKHQFTVAVTPSGNSTGRITSTPAGIDCGSTCSAKYDPGTVVTLTATADSGGTFVGWSGGGCTGTGDCVVTANADTTVTAAFAQDNTLVVVKAGNGLGTVTSVPTGINCGATCSKAFAAGTMVTLTATATNGSNFTSWSGGGCSGTGTCVVTVNAAISVTATFTLKQFTLTAAKSGAGSGTVASGDGFINCGATCAHTYDFGSMVTLTATAATGSTFASWSGGGCSGTAPCTVTVNAATTVTANFTLNQYTLTITKGGTGNGTVTSAPAGLNCGGTCAANFDYGTMVSLTATPLGNGDTFTGWSGGGCSGTGTCITTVLAATTVAANFNCGLTQFVFQYTGAAQTYTVPSCVTKAHIDAYGAAGVSAGTSTNTGGLGGYVHGDVMSLTPGQVLTVMVGGQKNFNGGGVGDADVNPGNGGDASDVRSGGTGIANRIIVAGGGGSGGQGDGQYKGGAGGGGTCGANYCGGGGGIGYDPAGTGVGNGTAGGSAGGTGAVQPHAGGAGGGGFTSGGGASCETQYPPTSCGTAGILGKGGSGDSSQRAAHPTCYSTWFGVAGGGGGYYGGGGSSVGFCGGGAGGGGSSWSGTLASPSFSAGVRSGNGLIVITPF